MDLNPVVLSIPIFFVLIGLELVYDAVQKKRSGQALYRWNDSFTNISCGIIDQVTGVFAKVFTVFMYAATFALFEGIRGYELPLNWWAFAATFVVGDFFYYWSHRWSHQVNLFWTGHVIHHQSEEYNLSVALRQGAFQKVLMFWIYLPMAALGFPVEYFISAMAFNLLYQFWIHTEAIRSLGPLEWVLNSPSHHRVHHGRNPQYIDRNHAGVFIVWDRLFGTFEPEGERVVYGITRPTKTFNPVLAHVQPFVRLAQDVRRIPSFGDRLKFLFKSPGWYPVSLGGPQAPPPTQHATKFDWRLPKATNTYLFAQYVLLIAGTSVFLFGLDLFSPWAKAGFTLWILFSLLSMGLVFDRRAVGRGTEVFRWCLAVGLAGAALNAGTLALVFGAVLTVAVGSLLWQAYLWRS